MKVVINRCYGGFGLSYSAVVRYLQLKGLPCFAYENDYKTDEYIPSKGENSSSLLFYFTKALEGKSATTDELKKYYFRDYDIERNDPLLVQTVEELGPAANGQYAELKVVEIPDGTDYEIDEYDGIESISEVHQKWY